MRNFEAHAKAAACLMGSLLMLLLIYVSLFWAFELFGFWTLLVPLFCGAYWLLYLGFKEKME